MGILLVFGSVGMMISFFWQVGMFTALFYSVKQNNPILSVIIGIIYILSVGISFLLYYFTNSVANYGGFSKDFTMFFMVVLAGMYLSALGVQLKKLFISLTGIILTVLPFAILLFYIFR